MTGSFHIIGSLARIAPRSRELESTLEQAIADTCLAVRQHVAQSLQGLPDRGTAARLLQLGLRSPSEVIRSSCARALSSGEWSEHLSYRDIEPLCADSSPQVRSAGYEALPYVAVDPASALRLLRAGLADPDVGVVRSAAGSAVQLHKERSSVAEVLMEAVTSGSTQTATTTLRESVNSLDPSLPCRLLRAAARDPRPAVRLEAIQRCERLPCRDECVLLAAEDSDPEIRRRGVEAVLASPYPADSLEAAVIRGLEDVDSQVVLVVLRAIADAPGSSGFAIPHVRALTTHRSEEVQAMAEEILKEIESYVGRRGANRTSASGR